MRVREAGTQQKRRRLGKGQTRARGKRRGGQETRSEVKPRGAGKAKQFLEDTRAHLPAGDPLVGKQSLISGLTHHSLRSYQIVQSYFSNPRSWQVNCYVGNKLPAATPLRPYLDDLCKLVAIVGTIPATPEDAESELRSAGPEGVWAEKCSAVVFTFSLTNSFSLQSIEKKWAAEDGPFFQVEHKVLVGTHLDCVTETQVGYNEGFALAQQIGATYFEVSGGREGGGRGMRAGPSSWWSTRSWLGPIWTV
jgi:hypothetical protein